MTNTSWLRGALARVWRPSTASTISSRSMGNPDARCRGNSKGVSVIRPCTGDGKPCGHGSGAVDGDWLCRDAWRRREGVREQEEEEEEEEEGEGRY